MMTAHNAEHRGESEAAAREFRREERVENPRLDFRRHTRAGIGDFEKNVFAIGQVGREMRAGDPRAIDPHHARAHMDGAGVFAERLARIDHQIHHDLLHLSLVGEHCRQARCEIEGERGALADRDAQEVRGFGDERVEIEPADDESAPAGIREHLPAQVRRPRRRALDLKDEFLDRRVRGQIVRREARVAEHAGQQVVEIVGDPAGEHAEAFELLRFLELAVEGGALGDILHEREHGEQASVGIAER